MRIVQLSMIYQELISSAKGNITLRSAMTWKIHASLMITNFNCIQPLHHNEIKYQGGAIPILCAMGAHGLQSKVEFSNFFLPYRLVMLSRRRSTAISKRNLSKLARDHFVLRMRIGNIIKFYVFGRFSGQSYI